MCCPFTKLSLLLTGLALTFTGYSQIGIGTTSPDPHSILTIASTTKGVLPPRLTSTQQITLSLSLTSAEKGMLITDATTGNLLGWTGTAFAPATSFSAQTPLTVSGANEVSLNPGTAVGDLITWDGNNWVNMQPAVQHFSFSMDNHQPYLVINYCIALNGIFPARSDATPFVSQIQAFGLNFAPNGWALCDGQILAISTNTALFSLLGTTYGGNGTSNFALPNLQSCVPIGFGQGAGLSLFVEGQTGGIETNTISH